MDAEEEDFSTSRCLQSPEGRPKLQSFIVKAVLYHITRLAAPKENNQEAGVEVHKVFLLQAWVFNS